MGLYGWRAFPDHEPRGDRDTSSHVDSWRADVRQCNQENPGTFRLCGFCGAELVPGEAPPEIRRTVTLVTSDLKGSTALGEKLDPESLREVLALYFDAMQLVFESHGGTIEKIIGDAIVAVFGLPTSGEDDALRAVRAAAETQEALAVLNERLERHWGVQLVNRTGIATGEVVVGGGSADEHILIGDVVELANRLEQSAPPTEVLIGEATYRIVADRITAVAVDPVLPKGASMPVPAYRLVSVTPAGEAEVVATRQCRARTPEHAPIAESTTRSPSAAVARAARISSPSGRARRGRRSPSSSLICKATTVGGEPLAPDVLKESWRAPSRQPGGPWRGTAARSRNSSATRSWRSSGCRSATRTTRSGRSDRRSR